jgi:NADPH2:quinone reductase
VSAAIGQRFARKGPAGIRKLAQQALDELAAGRLRPLVGTPFALSDAAGAHAAIEGRATIGKTVLVP